nr:uncharacterized protein CTRU02_13099 [Colletotrichum truncatum]KAF6783849.1 hypothetical protein CTRU02_13099 [Colletotrichum truncatum]
MLYSQLLTVVSFSLLVLCKNVTIDDVPGYSDLPACAQTPLSHMAQAMAAGCNKAGQKLSHSCFCTASSTQLSVIINDAVASNCHEMTNVTSNADQASVVFSSYCNGFNIEARATATVLDETDSEVVDDWCDDDIPQETQVPVASTTPNPVSKSSKSPDPSTIGLLAISVGLISVLMIF